MKNSLILLLSIFILSACGGKKVANTSFVLNAGALLSGAAANGGVAIVGTNGTDKFSVGLTPAQAQNFSLELNRGDWQFHAVAWLGGAGLMTGETRCGSATTSVEGTEVSISLTLNAPTCDSPTFSSVATQDTGEIFPTFKKVTLNSCLNPVGPFTAVDDCDGTQLHFLPGESVSTRLMIPGASNFGASLPSLQSSCINLVGLGSSPPNLKSGVMLSDIRLPAGGTVPFPAAIIGYENGNCSEITTIYPMPDGVTGSQGVGRIIDPSNGTRLKVSFADNYFGVIGSPFYQGNGSYVKVPDIKCTTLNCYDIDSTSRNVYSNGRDPARSAVWDLLGSRNQLSPNDWGWTGYATSGALNVTADTGTATFTLASIVDGLEVSANIQTDTSATVACSAGVDNIHVEIRVTTGATDPAALASLINGTPTCNTYISASSTAAPPTPATHTWTTGGITFSGLTPVLKNIRRDEGSLGDVKNMLLGPMSAILHKNGIQTGASLCTASGTFSDVVHGETITVSIGAASGSAVVADFSNSTGSYERKILLAVGGVAEEAFYFNCDTAGASAIKIYDGAYVSIRNEDSGDIGKLQIFWNVNRSGYPGEAWVEQTSTWQSSSGDHRSHSLLRVNTAAASDWDLWHVEGSDSHANYISLVGKASAGVLNVGYYSTNLSTSDVVVPIHDGTTYIDAAYTISSGGTTTVNVNTQDVATVYEAVLAPEIVVDRTIDDVMNGVISFWPLSN